jgi:endoglycosylceramidase
VALSACSLPSEPLVHLPDGSTSLVSVPTPDVVGPLQLRGTQLVDSLGRVVLIHGVNSVDKSAPFVSPLTDGWLGPDDFNILAGAGFNGVRLGVWSASLEPSPGVIDTAYLDQVEATVDALQAHHMWVLLDFHQDVFSGLPGWATLPDAASLSTTPPSLLSFIGWSAQYFSAQSGQQWTDWWNNAKLSTGQGVVDAFGDGIAAVADRFKDNPNVIGVELLNEPFPEASQVDACAGGSCPTQDALLSARFTELTNRVRAVAPTLPVWWEPITIGPLSPTENLSLAGVNPGPDGDQVGLSFHTYCLETDGGKPVEPPPAEVALCQPVYEKAFSNAAHITKAWNAPSMLTEFGASSSPLNVTAPTKLADQNLTSWLHWHYPFGSAGGQPPDVVESQLERVYAEATAGTPVSQSFDPATGNFTFVYTPDHTITAPTSIVVPPRQYTAGYTATVVGGTITSLTNSGSLTVVADPGATTVTVKVARAS